MGLASALSTALTGLNAAETTIDVVGNNLANSNTVGFKASTANFATQFLQTLSLGSAATTGGGGGTNPRQIGLGTTVADISPDFNQGTIEISANPTDLAIQGDGFFIVQGQSGEELYTRNGIFKMNANYEMVTITGNRLMGYGINDQFEIRSGIMQPLAIPLGSTEVAKSTENVYLEGTLTPTGDLATTAEIIETSILGDAAYSHPTTTPDTESVVPPSVVGAGAAAGIGGGSTLASGSYRYRIVYADSAYGGNPDTESLLSNDVGGAAVVVANPPSNQVALSAIPNPNDDPNGPEYTHFRVYRSTGAGNFFYIGESALPVAGNMTFTDTGLADGAQYDDSTINGSLSYYVTFATAAGGPGSGYESRPSDQFAAPDISNGRIHLSNLPTGDASQWAVRRIYRNLDGGSTFYYVGEVQGIDATAPSTFTDRFTDATIYNGGAGDVIDLDGPKITNSTLLTNVVRRDGTTYYEDIFEASSTLNFTGKKGGRTLDTKSLSVTANSTVSDLLDFFEESMGILTTSPDTQNPIPNDVPSGKAPGGYVTGGKMQVVGNTGVDNAIEIGLSGLQKIVSGEIIPVSLPFSSTQDAVGESAVADFIAYDSLGIPLSIRVTSVLEQRDGDSMAYRWFADSADNDPTTGSNIAVGTGLITFDGNGNYVSASNSTISVDRQGVPSASPLEFELNFSELSGLASDSASLAVSQQDGSAAGQLTSFIVGEDGTITGVFSNGITRTLGQIRLARFGNPAGLEQKGENLYSIGVNSGLPVPGTPGVGGIGRISSGAVELSNTDIGANLIDLILASTMYRGNTRVIITAQQMLDELLALRR